jgi:UDP-N-acetylglucosamine/UDP-N-acetylgalactosamine 4-epimerase
VRRIDDVEALLRQSARSWLVTGGAGFIGSHLVERLVALGQRVRVLDNLATGHRENLAPFEDKLELVVADCNDEDAMRHACAGVDVVLHLAALGSVPRSLADPRATHRANVDGFQSALLAARDAGVKRFVYASSSSVYGDHPALPKREAAIGTPLSPYAASKLINEIQARVIQDAYQASHGTTCIGLRYFNVFGPRQDPNGPYAAVIPRWLNALRAGLPCDVYGDGETSRDFCFVHNAVQANLLAALAPDDATRAVYNVAVGARTTLRELFTTLRDAVAAAQPDAARAMLREQPFRAGDVRHSLADITLARAQLGYEPTHDLRAGIEETVRAVSERAS